MPVIWEKSDSNCLIKVWHSSEDFGELLEKASLTDAERQEWLAFRSESRRREWLTVRALVREALPGVGEITYDENGKPQLPGRPVSISHSHEYIALMTSPQKKVGVDIEIIHPRIEKLARKFLSEQERNLFNPLSLESLHVMWSAKEVLYKIHGSGGLEFKKHLAVHPFDLQQAGKLRASINKDDLKRDFDIGYDITSNYILAWGSE